MTFNAFPAFFGFAREEVLWRGLQSLGNTQQLKIGDATKLRLNLGQRRPADVPPLKSNPSTQFVLSQTKLIPDLSNFRANDILPGSHAQLRQTGSSRWRCCYVFIADCA